MNLNKFSKVYPYVFTREIDYMFMAEYLDGALLFECHQDMKKGRTVKEVDKNKVIRFGLIGQGLRTYFNIANGIFIHDGNKIEMIYKTKEREYNLTNNTMLYNDLIYFKNAYTECQHSFTNNRSNASGQVFTGYNYGYKTKLTFDDGTQFYFKPILSIPLNQPTNLNIRLVSNKDLDGVIVIKINDLTKYELIAPLEKNIGGELTWFLRI